MSEIQNVKRLACLTRVQRLIATAALTLFAAVLLYPPYRVSYVVWRNEIWNPVYQFSGRELLFNIHHGEITRVLPPLEGPLMSQVDKVAWRLTYEKRVTIDFWGMGVQALGALGLGVAGIWVAGAGKA